MTIKKAAASDAEVIADLAKTIWTEHYTPIIGAPQVAYMLQKYQSADVIARQIQASEYVYFIAFAAEKAAGYCAVHWEEDKESIFLSKLYVADCHRNKGLARALLQAAVLEYPAYESVYLTVNKSNHGSIAAYYALGFRISGSTVNDIGNGFVMDDYIMTLVKSS